MSPQSVAAAAADFKKRIRGTFRIPEPAERTKQFQVLLDGMDNARLEATAWLIFERESLGDEVTGLWEQLFDHWGRGDFQAAIAFARHNGRPEGRRINYQLAQSRALTAQAEINPEAARLYIESPDCQYVPQMEGPNKGDCLVKGWSLSDPKAAAEWQLRQPTSPRSFRSTNHSHLLIERLTARYGPEETTAWFDSLDQSLCHPGALTKMGDALYFDKKEVDPGAAEAWLMTKLGCAWLGDSSAAENVVSSLSDGNPGQGMALAEQFQNAMAAIACFTVFTVRDHGAASEWLSSHPDYFVYDSLASSLARDLIQTRTDTEPSEAEIAAALPWAESVSDPATRALAIEEVREAAAARKTRE